MSYIYVGKLYVDIAEDQIPKAAYDNFRYLYPSWLDIRSIVSETVEAQLSAPTDVESQDVYKRLSVGDAGDDLALGRIPLKRLCPACFGDLAKRSCVCFDANFQNKAVWVGGEAATVDGGTAMGEAEIKIMARDTRDRRLTVDDEIGSESKQVNALVFVVLTMRFPPKKERHRQAKTILIHV